MRRCLRNAREAAHLARLDAAIAPLRTYNVSKADAANIHDAIQALAADKVDKGIELTAGITDPLGAQADRLVSPAAWPRNGRRVRSLPCREPALAERGDPARAHGGGALCRRRRLRRHHGILQGQRAAECRWPRGPGLGALGPRRDREGAGRSPPRCGARTTCRAELEHGFLARFGSLLTQAGSQVAARPTLWSTTSDGRAGAWSAPPLPSASSRFCRSPSRGRPRRGSQVFLHSHVAKSQLKAVPGAKSTDWGLVFHRIQQLRSAEKLDEAAKLVLSAPTDPDVVVNLDDWWSERQSLAYLALKADKPKLAYNLVRDAGPLSVNPLNEQTFMAGWIALRYLKDVDAADTPLHGLHQDGRRPLEPRQGVLLAGSRLRGQGRPGEGQRGLPGGRPRERHLPWPSRHAEALPWAPLASPSSRRRCPRRRRSPSSTAWTRPRPPRSRTRPA